jgi:hypothetical protein
MVDGDVYSTINCESSCHAVFQPYQSARRWRRWSPIKPAWPRALTSPCRSSARPGPARGVGGSDARPRRSVFSPVHARTGMDEVAANRTEIQLGPSTGIPVSGQMPQRREVERGQPSPGPFRDLFRVWEYPGILLPAIRWTGLDGLDDHGVLNCFFLVGMHRVDCSSWS